MPPMPLSAAEAAATELSGHAWRTQPAFDEVRPPLGETPTPSLEEMTAHPGAEQTLYRVTYQRVGRRGGCDGTPPPPPLAAWAISGDHLTGLIYDDVARYLTGTHFVVVGLDTLTGTLYSGFNKAGSFTLEALHTHPAGAAPCPGKPDPHADAHHDRAEGRPGA